MFIAIALFAVAGATAGSPFSPHSLTTHLVRLGEPTAEQARAAVDAASADFAAKTAAAREADKTADALGRG